MWQLVLLYIESRRLNRNYYRNVFCPIGGVIAPPASYVEKEIGSGLQF